MTHNFLKDKAYVRALLGSPARYLGMLGPAARSERILMELRDEGVVITDEDRARIHGPVGLDLGAEGPEEIAGRSSPRSSRCAAAGRAGSSSCVPGRSTIGHTPGAEAR